MLIYLHMIIIKVWLLAAETHHNGEYQDLKKIEIFIVRNNFLIAKQFITFKGCVNSRDDNKDVIMATIH